MPEVRDDQLPTDAGLAGEVDVRPASSVIVVRGEPLEVLMMRRTSKSTFVPGAWIFPGGTVDPIDEQISLERWGGDEEMTLRLCAARELIEEVALRLDGSVVDEEACRALLADPERIRSLLPDEAELDLLVLTSRWVTPEGVPKRYDTRFFLLEVDHGVKARHDGLEGVEHVWLEPREALARAARREMKMVFPTMKNLEAIADYQSAGELLDSRRDTAVGITRPRLIVEDGRKRIVLPEEA